MRKTTVNPADVKKRNQRANSVPKANRTKKLRKDEMLRDSSTLYSKDFSAMIASANYYNIDFLELAVMAGATLRGIAGQNVVLKIGQHVEGVPSTSVLFASDDARPQMRALESLTAVVGLLQDRLVQNQSMLSGRMALEAQGSARGHQTLQDGQAGSVRATRGLVMLANLGNDQVTEVAQRESVQHPRIMTTGISMEFLKEEIEACHQCHCLLIRPRIDDTQPDRRTLDKLESALRGGFALDQRHQNKGKRPVDRLNAQIIGPVNTEWLRQVTELGHTVMGEFMLLDQNPRRHSETDFNHLSEFTRGFKEILVKLLDTRLQLQVHQVTLRDPDACEAYMKMEAAYQSACDQLSQEPGRGIRGLPKLLLWTMGLYRKHFHTEQTERDLVKWVYSAASTLVNRHSGVLLRVRKMAAVVSKMKIADRIIEIIESEGPMKAWELRRRFNDQSKGDHDPLLRAMKEIGCLAPKDQRICQGKVAYDQARALLVDQILMEMAEVTFPDVSALFDKKPSLKIRETSTATTAKKNSRAA